MVCVHQRCVLRLVSRYGEKAGVADAGTLQQGDNGRTRPEDLRQRIARLAHRGNLHEPDEVPDELGHQALDPGGQVGHHLASVGRHAPFTSSWHRLAAQVGSRRGTKT